MLIGKYGKNVQLAHELCTGRNMRLLLIVFFDLLFSSSSFICVDA